MMERKHRCKLCCRNFANGRASGGHMRSHMMKFYAEEKAPKQEEDEEQQLSDDFHSHSSASTSSSAFSDGEAEEEFAEGSEENPRESTVFVDHEFSSSVFVDHEFSVVLQDRESETESSKKKKSIYRRSKRVRKSRISDFDRFSTNSFSEMKKSKVDQDYYSIVETEPLSSISDTKTEEHVAHCLIMLSKDTWEKEVTEHHKEEEEEEFGDDYSGVAKVVKTEVRGKYKCDACNKMFRSYQALGGHRASHKKIKPQVADESGGSRTAAAVVEEKIHQCPFCERIFSSGQALGGHKRSHFMGGGPISTNFSPIKQKSRIAETLKIDLNLPAPTDDETSLIADSAVSDAEFVKPIKQLW